MPSQRYEQYGFHVGFSGKGLLKVLWEQFVNDTAVVIPAAPPIRLRSGSDVRVHRLK